MVEMIGNFQEMSETNFPSLEVELLKKNLFFFFGGGAKFTPHVNRVKYMLYLVTFKFLYVVLHVTLNARTFGRIWFYFFMNRCCFVTSFVIATVFRLLM